MRFHIAIKDILSSPVRLKVARFLLTHEAPMSEREIASVLRISHMSINRAMIELAEVNFVYYKAVGKAHVWVVNQKSFAYQAIKGIVNAIDFCPSPLTELKKLILKYLPQNKVVRLILFGSIVKGEEKVDSDIDLLIVVKTDKDKDRAEPLLDRLSSDCLDIFGNRLSGYLLSTKEWKLRKSLEVIKEAQKGINLYDI